MCKVLFDPEDLCSEEELSAANQKQLTGRRLKECALPGYSSVNHSMADPLWRIPTTKVILKNIEIPTKFRRNADEIGLRSLRGSSESVSAQKLYL